MGRDEHSGFYCPHAGRMCHEVEHCNYRADNDTCMLRTAVVRLLGTMKRIQQSALLLAKILGSGALRNIWRDPHGGK